MVQPVPGPVRQIQIRWHVIRRVRVCRHFRRSPPEVVLECRAEPIVLRQIYVDQGLREAALSSIVHLLMLAVAGVHPHHVTLICDPVGVGRRPAQRFRPIGGESLGVLWVQAGVGEGVTDDRILQTPLVPGAGKLEEGSLPARRLVDRGLIAPSVGEQSDYLGSANRSRKGVAAEVDVTKFTRYDAADPWAPLEGSCAILHA